MITRCIGATIAPAVAAIIAVIYACIKAKIRKKPKEWPVILIGMTLLLILNAGFTWYGYTLRSIGLQHEEAGEYALALEKYREAHEIAGYAWTDLEECENRVYAPARYAEATALYKQKEYTKALVIFLELGEYGNSKTCVENCMRAYLESQS